MEKEFDEAEFNSIVEQSKRDMIKVYRSKDPQILSLLRERKKRVKIQNKGLIPYTDLLYKCQTCSSQKNNPDTAYCFICDTDNWIPPGGNYPNPRFIYPETVNQTV